MSDTIPPWHWLTELFHSSTRKLEDRKIGIEIERIGVWPDGHALHYESGVRPGAKQILLDLEAKYHWPMITNEQGLPLGFSSPLGKVSLEPGSQLELSTEPVADIPTLVKDVVEFEAKVDAVTGPWGLTWIGLGVNPTDGVDEIDVIPSTRYGIMTKYLGERGRLGTSMMRLTSSVQINLDYTSEAEAIEMLRVALAATPVSYALFGNSPISQGKETGFLSYRSAIWRETDPSRTGLLSQAFDEGFGFKDYARLAWNAPLMFAQDQSRRYVAANGLTLANIADGKIAGVHTDETNQINAVREIFTEARLKPGYVEVRSIDGLRVEDRYAATAFWVGLLYSTDARKLAMKLLGGLSATDREKLNFAASRSGLNAEHPGIDLADISGQLVRAAEAGLKERGKGEESFLAPLHESVRTRSNPADKVLQAFNHSLHRDTAKLAAYSAH